MRYLLAFLALLANPAEAQTIVKPLVNSGGAIKTIPSGDALQIPDLSGSGDRCVHADPSGTLSTTASDCSSGSGSGTVTNVATSGSVNGITLTGGPITTTGTITLGGTLSVTGPNFGSQTANQFLAAPNGSSGSPSFRGIVAADVPTLNQSTTGSAATLTTPRAINGVNFDGSAAITINAVDATPRVPTTRLVSTTAPLTGGGSLSGDLTLAISTFTSGAAGVVPSSGGGTVNFLRADGTWAAPPGATSGTVTSVAALTLGTTGTDLSSSVATSTTTPVITLNVPTASASNRGALSSIDWSTFNGKQSTLVSGTNIKTVGGVSLLGSGDVGIIGSAYGGAGSVSGILKANGSGTVSAATSGTDYAPATSGGSVLYGNGSGGFSNVTIGAGITFSSGTLSASGGSGGGGTSFPGSPAANQQFYRTDRNIQYYYDGGSSQWLSTTLYTLAPTILDVGSTTPQTATGTFFFANPWAGVYSIYITAQTIVTRNDTSSTNVNYFTIQPAYETGSGGVNFGTLISTQNDTQSQYVIRNATINQVLLSTYPNLYMAKTRVGFGSADILPAYLYRLIG